MSAELVLERRETQEDKTVQIGQHVLLTPEINQDYWSYRVKVSEGQAVVGFPKFGTIGIGFAVEEDWNTNLPYKCPTAEIRRHIWHNRGDDRITKEVVARAIRMIQQAAAEDRGDTL